MKDGSCPATQAAHSPRILNSNGSSNSNSNSNSRTHLPHLPTDLRLRILSLLPPHDLALAGRFTCRQAARRFGSSPQEHTARLSQPLPDHAAAATWCVEGARAAMRQLSLRHKLLLLSTAAASGCGANVEFAWQLLQPYVFPELLQTDHYHELLMRKITDKMKASVPNVGPAAVASGLAHLLPSLEQRCPGLLDPGATLEAAARHCDLAGLQAAWEVLGKRMISTLHGLATKWRSGEQRLAEVLERMLAAAAGSSTADAVAKMDWLLDKGRAYGMGCSADVWKAAAASGDVSCLQWLCEHGFTLGVSELLNALVEHASLEVIQQLEQGGSFLQLPPPDNEHWRSERVITAAASCSTDSAAKLRWLAARGAALGGEDPLTAAFKNNNVEALPLLWQHWRAQNPDGPALPASALACITDDDWLVMPDLSPLVTWLHQTDAALLTPSFYMSAIDAGDTPLLRWLLQAGCPRGDHDLACVLYRWPAETPAECDRMVQALQLLANAGWPWADQRLWGASYMPLGPMRHPWSVRRELLAMRDVHKPDVYGRAVRDVPDTGCVEMVEALARHYDDSEGGYDGYDAETRWYAGAAVTGDLAMLTCLQQLRMPLTVNALIQAIEQGAPLPALKWMAGKEVHVDAGELREAAGKLQKAVGSRSAYHPAEMEQERQEVETWVETWVEAWEEASVKALGKRGGKGGWWGSITARLGLR